MQVSAPRASQSACRLVLAHLGDRPLTDLPGRQDAMRQPGGESGRGRDRRVVTENRVPVRTRDGGRTVEQCRGPP